MRTISECPAEGRRTRWRCHRVASIEGAIKMLEKHVSDHRLCIHGAQPPCHHTAVCAMVDLGTQPARWPCLLRLLRPLASPYDVELPRSTLVARPAVHRNHLAPPSRHRGPNSAQTPPASHPASARPRSCCRYAGGSHSRRTALRSPAPPRVVLEEATSARDPRNVRRVHGESDLPQKSMSKTFRSGLGEAAAPSTAGLPRPAQALSWAM